MLSDSDQKMLIRLKGPPGFWPLMEILLEYVWPCSPWALFCVLSESQGTSAVRGPAGPGEITAQSPAPNCPGIRISKPALPCLSLSSRVQRHAPSWTGIPASLPQIPSHSPALLCLLPRLRLRPSSGGGPGRCLASQVFLRSFGSWVLLGGFKGWGVFASSARDSGRPGTV